MKGCLEYMLNVQEIQELIRLIDQTSIEEFKYETSGASISLKKSSTTGQVQPKNIPEKNVSETVAQIESEKASAENTQDASSQKESTVDYDHEIVSPMVGTFYAAPSPERENFVSIGSKVDKSSVVCIVEAMKLFNEIEAEVEGEIVEILVENGELVEYGQPLFRVSTK